jgi:hypothetical protein
MSIDIGEIRNKYESLKSSISENNYEKFQKDLENLTLNVLKISGSDVFNPDLESLIIEINNFIEETKKKLPSELQEKIGIIKYDNDIVPNNYLENLEEYLRNNQLTPCETKFNEIGFKFTADGNDIELPPCAIKYIYNYNNGDWDKMLEDYKKTMKFHKEKENFEDVPYNAEISFESLNHIKQLTMDESSIYFKTKKGLIFVVWISNGAEIPFFVDDLGIKFVIKNHLTGETFDSNNYI